jgi:choloylglycine hydrolase
LDSQTPPSCSDADVRHCTVFTVSQGEQVFFAGNDDYHNTDSTYWVKPGTDTRYGAIFFGKPDNIQQGFNEKGLAYDANGLPKAPVTSHPGQKPVYGSYSSYPIQILQECATVEEVIAWVQEHRWHTAMHDQLHFADASGDAVVISAGADGQVVFNRKPAGDGFLLSTNFNLANPNNGDYPCWRFTKAEKMLSRFQNEDGLTVEKAAEVAKAVHVEGPSGWTLYSVVADLRQQLVYIHFMFQYDAPLVLSIDEELTRSQAPVPLSSLLPAETQLRADEAYQSLRARSERCDRVSLIWLGMVGLSLLALVFLRRPGCQGLRFWVPVVAVLGPLGLLVWLMAGRGRRGGALVEAAGDLPPYVLGIVAGLLAALLVPEIRENKPVQLLTLYGIPLTVGLCLYQAPRLARTMGTGYRRALWCRLPAALVSTNLALAGILAVFLTLIDAHIGYCGISDLILLPWWVSAVAGAALGGLFLFAYHLWAVGHGFTAWSVLLGGLTGVGEGQARAVSPPWRRLWLWILLSFALLIGGTLLGINGPVLLKGMVWI